MVYGIISAKDNNTSLAFFKSKKVSQGNLVTADRLQQLANTLRAGDVVYVVSVDRFPSVNAFVMFAGIILKTGASMKILEQPYLDVGNGRHYKASVEEHLKVLAGLESANASRLIGALKLTDAGKGYVSRCITDITIGILAKTYASDGIEFANRPSEFPKLVRKVKKYCVDGKQAVFGLENAYGYGRSLAVWLINKGYVVKDVNTSLSHRESKHRAMFKKSDRDDAQAVALVTINMLHELPDACPNDAYWSLGQLVHRRDNIMSHMTRLKNQLHEHLCISYPSYKKFFTDIGRPTALYFWKQYPAPKYLRGKTVEDLRDELVPISHNRCSTKTCQNILDTVKGDKALENDYQDSRDMIIRSLVRDLKHYEEQLKEMDKAIEELYDRMGCTLTTIPGVNVITAAKIASEIGDVRRFKSASKLAQFAAIAPLKISSSNSEKTEKRKEGNRRLQSTIYFLAIQMIQVSTKGVPRNPVFRDYYERRTKEGKPSKQVLICISRRLICIIYGMLKTQTEYRMPQLKEDTQDLEMQG